MTVPYLSFHFLEHVAIQVTILIWFTISTLINIHGKLIGSDTSGVKVDLANTKITSENQMHDAHTEMEISHVKLDKGRVVHVLALVL